MNENYDNTQHYRDIAAEWYDTILENETKDTELYRDLITKDDEPVLELACGTGRLMLPILEKGITIEGLDSSDTMLKMCRQKIEKAGLKTQLFHQKMEELDAVNKYKTIFVSGGSFQMLNDSDLAIEVMKKVRQALTGDGKFLVDIFLPWTSITTLESNVWRTIRNVERNNRNLIVTESPKFDPINQLIMSQFKYEVFENGHLIDTFINRADIKFYGLNEFSMMLEKAGFSGIEIDHKDLFSHHDYQFSFTAYK